MSYSSDGLFYFEETESECFLAEYLKGNDPSVTEIEIPAEHNGLPIVRISDGCFRGAKYIRRVKIPPSVRLIGREAFDRSESLEEAELSEGLKVIRYYAFAFTKLKSIVLPKSLNRIDDGVFALCTELESVIFNSVPKMDAYIFFECPKLPPETIAMGLVCSTDITSPFPNTHLQYSLECTNGTTDIFRADVFEILAKNNCFRECNTTTLFEKMTDENKTELFRLAEQYGMLDSAELVDGLLSHSIEKHNTELTAYFLELKNRKFGFNGGNQIDI